MNPLFQVFDFLTLDEFNNQEGEVELGMRLTFLKGALDRDGYDGDTIQNVSVLLSFEYDHLKLHDFSVSILAAHSS